MKNVDEKVLIIQELQGKVRALQKELFEANEHINMLSTLKGVEGKQFGKQLMDENFTSKAETKKLLAVSRKSGENRDFFQNEETDALTESQVEMKQMILPQVTQNMTEEEKAQYIIKHHTFEKLDRGQSRSGASREDSRSTMSKDDQLAIVLKAAGLDMKEKNNHLIHSINKVTDLLKSNHELRE